MYTIAVCDDEPKIAKYISEQVTACLEEKRRPATVDWYSDPNELMRRLEENYCYDALLLDIDMPGLDGIALCRRFRNQDGDSLIVFISNREELVFQTFEVSPFRFIRKSHFIQELGRLCRDLDIELDRRKDTWLRFSNEREGTMYSLNIRKLMYVEAMGKVCRLCSTGDSREIKIRLQDLEEKLRDFGFIFCHRSYLVNPNFIYCIRDDVIVLDNDETIPVSRGKRQQTKDLFFQWSRSQL